MSNVHSHEALLPLTIFDDAWSPTNFATGWIVEGIVDEAELRAALVALTHKWRLLAGRLHKTQDTDSKWLLRVPLGSLPPEYARFSLTSRVSSLPLSSYVTLPLPTVSRFPPSELFMPPSMPKDSAGWATHAAPLTFWHLTYFLPDENDPGHTCIGFAWPHGVFDGVGASLILHALEDELHGRAWDVPFPLTAGYNENPLQRMLDDSTFRPNHTTQKEYKGMCAVPWWMAIIGILWCAWETWWLNAQYRLVVVPRKVYLRLAEKAREDAKKNASQSANLNTDPDSISTGDVLTAFLFKAFYEDDSRSTLQISCTYFMEFRKLFSNLDPTSPFKSYPHNAFVPVPYPPITSRALRAAPLSAIAHALAASRHAFALSTVAAADRFLRTLAKRRGFLFNPAHVDAHSAIMVSNVSAQRIAECDWSAFGAHRTLASYRFNTSPLPVKFTKLFSIAGRLEDGSALLDGVLTERDWERVGHAFEKMIGEYS